MTSSEDVLTLADLDALIKKAKESPRWTEESYDGYMFFHPKEVEQKLEAWEGLGCKITKTGSGGRILHTSSGKFLVCVSDYLPTESSAIQMTKNRA